MQDKKLLALGFSTVLIEEIRKKSLSLTGLRGISQTALARMGFSERDAITIRDRVSRKPIPSNIVDRIIFETGGVCCYCANGNHAQPFQIHHINDYASSRDHSPTNLMLVCPTHHVYIHQSKVSSKEQQEIKRAWTSMWELASQYVAKGLTFPFGAFEYIDYSIPGSVTDIFSFGPAKPQMCEKLAEGPLLQNALGILYDQNKILITGDSGSGKTTLSLALSAKVDNSKVYRYWVGEKGSAETMQEVLTFLSFAIKPIVLIIDDASSKIVDSHIEKILGFAQNDKKLVVVSAKQDLSIDSRLEQRVAGLVFPVTWSALQLTVKENMQRHEHVILGYLKSKGLNTYNGRRIGYALADTKFSEVLDSYATGTNTVWQFIFMLASGKEVLKRRLAELYDRGRLDLMVMFLGVNHIATGEQGASLADIHDFYRMHPYFENQSQPSSEWLNAQLDQLTQWGMIRRNRDRYNLAHRMLALNFLELSYTGDKLNTDLLLDMFFAADRPARQVLILWSWLRDTVIGSYVSKWIASLSPNQWKQLTDQVMDEGLMWLNVMTIMLSGFSEVLGHVLKDRGEAVANIIGKQGKGRLNDFIQLSTPFKNNAPDSWQALLQKLDQKKFYQLILHAKAWELYNLDSLFNVIRELGYTSWILSFTGQFSKSDFKYMASRLDKGDVQAFSGLIKFWRRFVFDISVGEFVEYMAFVPKILKGSDIKDYRFDFHHRGYSEIMSFPELIDKIMEELDPDQMAREFVSLTPDHWANVLLLSYLSEYGQHRAIADFMFKIDLDRLIQNIEIYYLDHLHGFRLMIYQLTYDKKRRKEIAVRLRPLVDRAVQKSISQGYKEHEDMLYAFKEIDAPWVDDYCFHRGILLKQHKKFIGDDNDGLKTNAFYLKDLDLDGLMPANKISVGDPGS